MPYVIGVDVGGTFTDSVVVDDSGQLTLAKAFSTPDDLSAGIINSLAVAAEELRRDLGDLLQDTRLFLHSTSVAENAIVDGTLAPAGVLTTDGFEHTLHMTRGGYGRWSGRTEEDRKNLLDLEKPPHLLPFSMVLPVPERTDSLGRVLLEADAEVALNAVRQLVKKGAISIGICFLWSFRNSANELAVRRLIEREFPELFVTVSHELAPIEGEYERISTVALNARLEPVVDRYLQRLEDRLRGHGLRTPLLVMQAHGGLVPVSDAPSRAVGMIESGPVGGLIASKAIGELVGVSDILAADMGGTTFKVGLVRSGRIEYEREPMVVRYHYALHKMEVVSIGVAGGSIISLEATTGRPRIGPRSAGASPGPVCYGFGGTEPTVTDMDMLLGYLDARFFVGGRESLDYDGAFNAFSDRVARPLSMEPLDAAMSVYRLTNSILYDLLHKQTVQKGLDPRHYSLFVYGGSAGMHLPSIGPALGVRQVIVPLSASVQGAFGTASSDVVYTASTTQNLVAPGEADALAAIFKELSQTVRESFEAAGFEWGDVQIATLIGMRYRRQVHSILTPVALPDRLGSEHVEAFVADFERLYAERYGPESGYRAAGIEMVSFLVRGSAALQKPRLKREDEAEDNPGEAFVESRPAYVAALHQMRTVPCYDFARIRPGNTIHGPAVIWSPVTTVVVDADQRAHCDPHRNLVITWPKEEHAT